MTQGPFTVLLQQASARSSIPIAIAYLALPLPIPRRLPLPASASPCSSPTSASAEICPTRHYLTPRALRLLILHTENTPFATGSTHRPIESTLTCCTRSPQPAAPPLPPRRLLSSPADTRRHAPSGMSMGPQQQYGAPARPAFAPLQSASTSHSTSYSSNASMDSRTSSTASAPPPTSPATASQQQHFYGSLNQQTQQPHQQRLQAQRHPSFEYQPNRSGAGQTAAETTNFLAQTSLLAEAAKRAQMACVMRDLDGMEL